MEVKVKVFENSNVNIDNFSKDKPVLSNISKNIEKEIKLVLNKYLNNQNILQIKYIGNFKSIKDDSNSFNFKVILKNKNIFLLKKIHKNKHNNCTINKMVRLMIWCEKKKIPMPTIHSTKKNKPYCLLNKHYWLLMEYLDGTHFKGSINQFKQSALNFGYLIKKIANLPKTVTPTKYKKPYFHKKEAQIFENLKNTKKNWEAIFGNSMAVKLRKNWKLLNSIWIDLNKTSYLLKKFCFPIHHDLHPHNLIFFKKKCFILDYESFILGPIQSAMGFSVLKLLKYMHDNNYKKSFQVKSNQLLKSWLLEFNKNFPNEYKQEEILKFGKAEIFRRFLSMVDKSYRKESTSFNGPEVHLDTLLVSNKI